MNYIKTLATVVLFILISGKNNAQKPSDFASLKTKYPGEKAVIINDKEDILVDVDKDSYKITESVIKETFLMENAGNTYASDKIYSSHFAKINSVEAKTLVPDGNKFTVKKVEKFVESNNHPDYVFYDEQISKSFIYPAVQTGAITSLKFIREISDPLMIGSFFFKWNIPCEISRISIKADKKAKIKFKLFNIEPSSLDFKQEEKGKYMIYTWTAKNIKADNYEPDAPDIRYYYPHIVYYIDDLNPMDTANQNFNGLNGLYHYYRTLIKDLNTKDDTSLSENVANIIAGAGTEEEKVKRIFYWVQDNINYIAFEEGMQGFIPEQASKVYYKRYGDCKGMASLMNNMLTIAGIKSYLTWIGTRHLPYKYTDIPTEIVDNHMIVTWYQNGKPIFLDGTNHYLPFGMPSSMIQGKQALVAIDEKNYKIEEVPVLKSDQNIFNDSCRFTLHNNYIEGSGQLTLTGYEKNNMTYYLTQNDSIKTKEHLLGFISKGNNKFFMDSFHINNLYKRETPLEISYKFRVDDYFREIDGEVYLNMSLNKLYANHIFDPEKHLVPVEFNNATLHRYVSVFQIPEGYHLTSLPKDQSKTTDKFSFFIRYKIEGNNVIQTKEIRNDYIILDTSGFKTWNDVIESLNQAYRDVLILKKN